MPEVRVHRLHPTKPEFASLEAKIIAQRNEYVSLDFPEYEHVYLGFIEGGLDDLVSVLHAEVNATRSRFQSAVFTLEYHPSCITHTEYPFLVYSFTLTQILRTKQGSSRKFSTLSLVLPRKDEYRTENTAIEQLMERLNIEPYDDGSGVSCRIEPEIN